MNKEHGAVAAKYIITIVSLVIVVVGVYMGYLKHKDNKQAAQNNEFLALYEQLPGYVDDKVIINGEKLEGTFDLTTNSSVGWAGRKVGGSHYGEVPGVTGTVTFEDGEIEAAEVVVDMTTITVADIPVEDEGNQGLVDHLSNDDFFAVDAYPTASLSITEVEEQRGSANATGVMTIKGIENPIAVNNIKISRTEGTIQIVAMVDIDRTDYDITFNSASIFSEIGDAAIDDIFNLTFKGVIELPEGMVEMVEEAEKTEEVEDEMEG